MLDLHCHILPGVDDGAVDIRESVAMARSAIDQGCRAVVATSHLWENLFDTSPELLREEYLHVSDTFLRQEVPLDVRPGAENFLSDVAPDEFAEKAVPLGEEGRYVLVDFSLRDVPPRLSQTIEALSGRGKRTVIAHPERNLKLQADPLPIADWIEQGAVIQVNAGSLLGILGSAARKCGEYLLESGAAHVLASDAHDRKRRPFCLQDGRDAAARLVGEEEADRLAREAPWKILKGEEVMTSRVRLEPPSGARRLLRRLLDLRH